MELILAIDDDNTQLMLLNEQLTNHGYKIITSLNGRQGIELAKTGNPSLIILDINMPVMDGFEVIRKLREDQLTRNIPIIMLTSNTQKEAVIKALRQNVADYIIKPYDLNRLLKKISVALASRDYRQELEESGQSIAIIRQNGRAILSVREEPGLLDKSGELYRIVNSAFLTMIRLDHCIIDLRQMPQCTMEEIPYLQKFIGQFGDREVYIAGGRHYGLLITGYDPPENVQLFISMGDVEFAIDSGLRG